MKSPTLIIEKLAQDCVKQHGGFQHGEAVGFCASCQTWLQRYFELLGLL